MRPIARILSIGILLATIALPVALVASASSGVDTTSRTLIEPDDRMATRVTIDTDGAPLRLATRVTIDTDGAPLRLATRVTIDTDGAPLRLATRVTIDTDGRSMIPTTSAELALS